MLRGSVFKYIANLDDVDVEDEVETYEEHCPLRSCVSTIGSKSRVKSSVGRDGRDIRLQTHQPWGQIRPEIRGKTQSTSCLKYKKKLI